MSVRGLMLVVLAAGWAARVVAVRREALATIRAAGGTIRFRDQLKNGGGVGTALYLRTGWDFAREIFLIDLNKPSAQARGAGEPRLPDPTDPPPRDEVFAALGRLGHVESVQIEAGPIPPALREALAAAGVVRLSIPVADGANLDQSLTGLGRVRSLQTLVITASGRTPLPSATLRWVGAVTQLRRFVIQPVGGQVGAPLEADATTLSRLTDLDTLYLGRSPANSTFLDGLAAGHQLKELMAPATRPTDAQLRRLAEQEPNLERLELDGSLLSDAGTEALGRLPRLQQVDLHGRPGAGSGITDATLATLARLGALRVLRLTSGRFTDRGLEALRKATRIDILDLGWFDSASPEALTRLLAGRAWRSLGLRGPGITDANLAAILLHMGSTKALWLVDSGVTDASMTPLGRSAIQTINLSGTPITDAGMAALAAIPARRMSLNRTALTDAGLMSLAKAVSLGQLDVRGTNITPGGVAAFRRSGRRGVNIQIGPPRLEDD